MVFTAVNPGELIKSSIANANWRHVGRLGGDLLPYNVAGAPVNDTYSLGDLTHAWKNLYLSAGSSIFIDGVPLEITPSKIPVRQTVLTGPVDANGRADFLEAGTGLVVTTKDVTASVPLIATLGNGFDETGQVDLTFKWESNINFTGLTDATTVYLYGEYDASLETWSYGNTELMPAYSYAKPSAPATGQYWYPTDHRSMGEVWNGSIWVPTNRIYFGQAVTAAGAVTSVTSYAYQGKWRGSQLIALSGSYTLNTNIGVSGDLQKIKAFHNSVTGAEAGVPGGNGTSGWSNENSISISVNVSLGIGTMIKANLNTVFISASGNYVGAVIFGGAFTGSTLAVNVERGF